MTRSSLNLAYDPARIMVNPWSDKVAIIPNFLIVALSINLVTY